jgi:AraC-like DNA-binding protein
MIAALPIHKPLVFRPTDSAKERLNSLFGSLFSEYGKDEREIDTERDPHLAVRFLEILLTVANGINTYTKDSASDGKCEKIVKYINENYASISCAEQIAEHFYISKYHLCHLFSKSLGVGLIAYLNTIKIRAAARMLEEKKHTVTEIATSCGFNSPSYFCKVFKREIGVSPRDYKK